MSKIIGVTVGTTLPKPNFKQTDPTKGDYIKNKPDFDGLKSKVEQIEVRVDTMQENAYDDTELRGVVSENVARIDTLNELVGNTKVETQIGDAVATLESEIDNKLNTMQSAIDSKVDAEDGKGLSTNDYTTAEKDKLATIEDNANLYEHPVHTSYDSGLYKVTVDGEGHVSSAAFVEKEDIVALGIPAQDTTYDKEISDLSDRIDYEAGLRENTNDGLLMVFEEFNKYKESNNKAVSANASGINVNQLAIAEIQEDYLKEADKIQLQDEIKKASDKATENTEAIKILNGEGAGSVKQSIDNAFNEFAANVTNDDVVNTYKELIDYAANHGSEFTELVGVVDKINNDVTGIETDISNYKIAVSDQLSEVNASINTIQGTLENKADSEHDHNDLYYTKDEILESITVDDIDDICEFQGSGDGVNLVNMATEEWVQNNYQPKGNYLTDVPSGYATEEFVENKIAAAELGSGEISLSDYAKKSELPTKVSQLTNDANYVKTEDIPTKTSQLTNDSGYWNSANYDSAIIGQGYVTCSTAAATVDKAVSLSNYLLKPGGIVSVRFVYSVPANATLCINHKAIIPIYYRNAAITDNVIKAGDIATFMFNGAKYTLLSIDRWQKDILDLTTEIGTKISIETDPTVPAWAKAANKPSYTASEVGLGNVDNVRQYSVNNPPPYPVTSVNGLTGDVKLNASTYVAQPEAPSDTSVLWLDTDDDSVESGTTSGIDVTGAEVGQTIRVKAVDENGKPTEWEAVDFPEGGGATTWEDVGTTGYTEGIVLQSANLVDAGDGMFMIMEPFDLVPDKEYHVFIRTDTMESGESFTCLAEEIYVDGSYTGVAIGNNAVVGGSIESDAPFCIIAADTSLTGGQFGGMYVPLDGATEVSLRNISGPVAVIRQVPAKYLPNNPFVVHFSANDSMTTVIADKSFADVLQAVQSEACPVVGYLTIEGQLYRLCLNCTQFADTDMTFFSLNPNGINCVMYFVNWFDDESITFEYKYFNTYTN